MCSVYNSMAEKNVKFYVELNQDYIVTAPLCPEPVL